VSLIFKNVKCSNQRLVSNFKKVYQIQSDTSGSFHFQQDLVAVGVRWPVVGPAVVVVVAVAVDVAASVVVEAVDDHYVSPLTFSRLFLG
jgi:hypothetical protein